MNLNIIFNAPSLERNKCFSIIQDVNDHLKELSVQLGKIESAEIKLYDTMEDHTYNNKAALITIKFESEYFIEYKVAGRWDKVITDAFHGLMAKGIIRNLYHHA
jgi:hypothetical protein